MDPASASLRVIRALSKADDVPRGVIRAYHGSPHSFSRFDASKIGTGEGAQAYGHGLYFAGTEDTADFYRRKLSENGDAPERWARDFWDAQSAPDAIGSPEAAYDYLLKYIRSIRNAGPGSSYSPGLKRHYAAAEKYLLSQDPYIVPPPVRQGHMYEVELGVPEESLLDWDAPISDQTNVRQRLGSLGDVALRDRLTGRNVYELMQAQHGNDRNASSVLTEFGIPGIQYFDAGSRSQQQGTRNYVMFPGTEDRIRILRQYGLLPPLVGAAAMEEE